MLSNGRFSTSTHTRFIRAPATFYPLLSGCLIKAVPASCLLHPVGSKAGDGPKEILLRGVTAEVITKNPSVSHEAATCINGASERGTHIRT